MKSLQFISTLVFSCFTHAAGTIDYLKIDQDVVLFSTTEDKTEASPACMAADNSELWSASLRSEAGRAIYSMLSIAIAKDLSIDVESAGDCADLTEFERASGVNLALAAETEASSSGAKSIGVYQADGVTRIGTFLSWAEAAEKVHYITGDASIEPKSYKINIGTAATLYYSGSGCTGNVFSQENDIAQNSLLPQLYEPSTTGWSSRTYLSRRTKNSDLCIDYDSSSTINAYIMRPYENGECGEGLCVLKED
jgi:hypothetical protein